MEEQAHIDQWMHFAEYEISMFSLHAQALNSGHLGAYSKEVRPAVRNANMMLMEGLLLNVRCSRA